MVASLRSKWGGARVARSLRINLDMFVAPPASLREALRAGRGLKNSQLIRRLPIGVNLTGRDQDCTGRTAVGENQSRRDPAKVAQYEVLGKRF
jgi:hypothetical protein